MAPKLARLSGVEKVLLSVRKDHHGWAKTSGNTTRIDASIKEPASAWPCRSSG